MQMNYINQREEVAKFMRRLYERGLTTCSGGNISVRVSNEHFAISASGFDKGSLTWEQVGVMGFDGVSLTPELKLSIETGMHKQILMDHRDVVAVVHAHPPYASAYSASDEKINCSYLAESRALLGEPSYAEYAMQGTEELARIVSRSVHDSKVVVMANHGILTVGKTLLQAFDRIEVLENAARISIALNSMAAARGLTEQQIKEIDDAYR